ncbi:Uu.00g008530.m01.CDS01 [Anthostomella pinea]|uniref:Uu.00g008530.m01.CDS01 n=1 Tax=Anthostomella pinea TaxID=933095 RepID=A0AAI8VXW0_9PEZI|nr:Uu.00g008530.m01.CDS01 [Anthostomella pinea]
MRQHGINAEKTYMPHGFLEFNEQLILGYFEGSKISSSSFLISNSTRFLVHRYELEVLAIACETVSLFRGKKFTLQQGKQECMKPAPDKYPTLDTLFGLQEHDGFCYVCQKYYASYAVVRDHKSLTHVGLQCHWGTCATTTTTEADMKTHIMQHNNDAGAPLLVLGLVYAAHFIHVRATTYGAFGRQ